MAQPVVPAAVDQVAALVVYQGSAPPVRASQVAMILAYMPEQARAVRADQVYALVPYKIQDAFNRPRASLVYELVVWGSGNPSDARSRAWTFVLDGHTFYVLDLGAE